MNLPEAAIKDPTGRLKLPLSSQAKVGGGSVDRVRSDALPLTMHADKLTVPTVVQITSTGDAAQPSENFSHLNSATVDVCSSLESLTSSKPSHQPSDSSASSVLGSQGELHTHISKSGALAGHSKQNSNDSFLSSVLAPSHGKVDTTGMGTSGKGYRPSSAPTRAISDSLIPTAYSQDSPRLLKPDIRKSFVENARQKRMANIAESARAALTFSAIHRSKKVESLPRDCHLEHSRNHFGSKSVGSEEELFGSSNDSSLQLKESRNSIAGTSTPSSPFNLRNMSMDETRKASLNEMEEIWKLVENESTSSSTSLSTAPCQGAGGVSGVSGVMLGERGPPSIALESHMSPKRKPSEKSGLGKERTERRYREEKGDIAVLSPEPGEKQVADLEAGEDVGPLSQSTPKRIMGSGQSSADAAIRHKTSTVSSKGEDAGHLHYCNSLS